MLFSWHAALEWVVSGLCLSRLPTVLAHSSLSILPRLWYSAAWDATTMVCLTCP